MLLMNLNKSRIFCNMFEIIPLCSSSISKTHKCNYKILYKNITWKKLNEFYVLPATQQKNV